MILEFLIGMMMTVSKDTLEVGAVYYHPKHQSVTASGHPVNHNLRVRWIAASRDLLKNRTLKYGDTIEVISEECPALNGDWVVRDKMGPRHRKMIDFLLLPGEPEELEFWMPHKVKIVIKK